MYDIELFMQRLLQLIDDRGGRVALSKKCFVSINTLYLWTGKQQTRPTLATVMEALKGLEATPEEVLWLFGLEQSDV